jgi:peroxiredoxin
MVVWLAIIAIELGLVVLTLWGVLYQLVKQQGRILLRQDELEMRVGYARNASANGLSVLGVRAAPSVLAAGTPVERFAFPDLDGRTVGLDEFAGKPVLLIHWNPQCGYCDLLAADLADIVPALRSRDIHVLLLSHGSADANRKLALEHKLTIPILLIGDGANAPEVFRNQGTPVAYLLDRSGKIASGLATGTEQILTLARGAANDEWKRTRLPGEKPLSESKIERNGLKAGAAAPLFRLPDVHGGDVALEEFRGRKVLLVFSDPHCGPCDQVAPHLNRLHRQRDELGLDVILIGRGEFEENRRKAEALGFQFPVVTQNRWTLSREYGIFATPVAFLIDESGIIAKDVAKGVDGIAALSEEITSDESEAPHESAIR